MPVRPQLVALAVAASLTAGWLLASVVSPPVARLQDLPPRAVSRGEAAGDEPEMQYAEQLRFRLQAAPPRRLPGRNPFVFVDRVRVAPERREEVAPPPPTETAAPPAAVVPPLRLSGIATTRRESGIVLTAIISDGSSVHLLTAGEVVGGYTVSEVTENGVALTGADGRLLMLRLQ